MNKKFDKDLKYGQERENRIVSILDKDKTKMEVKTERDWWFKTNNIAIEVECYGKPSGIMATEADYWVHILANGDKDYCRLIFDTATVKHVGKTYTEEELRRIWQGSWAGKAEGDPFIVRGGYRCRHTWLPVVEI